MIDQAFSTLKQVSLHMGAHKTASTHLQRSLFNGRGLLSEAAIDLKVAEILRKNGIVLPANLEKLATGDKVNEWRKYFELACQDRTKLIVSDENLLGALPRAGLPESLVMYKTATARLGVLQRVFAGTEMRVFVAIRNPSDYLESCYSQGLLHGRWASVEHFKKSVPLTAIKWVDAVQGLAAQLPTVVWRQEDYISVFPQIIKEMASVDLAKTIPPAAEKHQVGLSNKATELILENKILRSYDARAEYACSVRNLFPPTDRHDKFRFFDRLTRMEAMATYERDVEAIKAIPNVTFLRP